MKTNKIEKYQTRYYRNINEALDIQQLANMIQFGGSVVIDENSLAEREINAYEILTISLKPYNFDMQKILEKFTEYSEVIQSIYLELGIQAGICLQTELLSKTLEEN